MKTLRLLVLALLFTSVCLAQDTTCDAGDVAWVVDSQNANEGAVGGGGTSEYNNTGAPWGIQAVFDEACAGLDIRIVVGSNNYNSGSTSWNNRDDTTKQININTVAGTEVDPILITGYASLGGAKSLATLDFDSASITGADGLNFSTVADKYVIEFIRVTDADDDCIESDGLNMLFIRNEFDNCGLEGLNEDAGQAHIAFNWSHDNGTRGFAVSSSLFFGNESSNNTTDGFFGVSSCVVGNLFYANGNDGATPFDNSLFAFNTIRANTDDGIQVDPSAERISLWGNIITGHSGAGDIGLFLNGGHLMIVADNNYGDNTTARSLTGALWVDDDSTPDTTTCTFISSTDHEVVTNCTFTFTFPRTTTSTTFLKGGVQDASGGGGTTTIITQGVSF